jgi:hypothetical protein
VYFDDRSDPGEVGKELLFASIVKASEIISKRNWICEVKLLSYSSNLFVPSLHLYVPTVSILSNNNLRNNYRSKYLLNSTVFNIVFTSKFRENVPVLVGVNSSKHSHFVTVEKHSSLLTSKVTQQCN